MIRLLVLVFFLLSLLGSQSEVYAQGDMLCCGGDGTCYDNGGATVDTDFCNTTFNALAYSAPGTDSLCVNLTSGCFDFTVVKDFETLVGPPYEAMQGDMVTYEITVTNNGIAPIFVTGASDPEAPTCATAVSGAGTIGSGANGQFLCDILVTENVTNVINVTARLDDFPSGDEQTETGTAPLLVATPDTGACCLLDRNGTCQDAMSEVECLGLGGFWNGNDTECATQVCEMCFASLDEDLESYTSTSDALLNGPFDVTDSMDDPSNRWFLETNICVFSFTGSTQAFAFGQGVCSMLSNSVQNDTLTLELPAETGCDSSDVYVSFGYYMNVGMNMSAPAGFDVIVERDDGTVLGSFLTGELMNVGAYLTFRALVPTSTTGVTIRLLHDGVSIISASQFIVDDFLVSDCGCPKGACCQTNGSCTESLFEAECSALNVMNQFGANQTCEEFDCNGACCLLDRDGSCNQNLTLMQCMDEGGLFAGEGTLCVNQTVKMCFESEPYDDLESYNSTEDAVDDQTPFSIFGDVKGPGSAGFYLDVNGCQNNNFSQGRNSFSFDFNGDASCSVVMASGTNSTLVYTLPPLNCEASVRYVMFNYYLTISDLSGSGFFEITDQEGNVFLSMSNSGFITTGVDANGNPLMTAMYLPVLLEVASNVTEVRFTPSSSGLLSLQIVLDEFKTIDCGCEKGACCGRFENESLCRNNTFDAECEDQLSGAYQGDGSVCLEDTCPTGVCCDQSLPNCTEGVLEHECPEQVVDARYFEYTEDATCNETDCFRDTCDFVFEESVNATVCQGCCDNENNLTDYCVPVCRLYVNGTILLGSFPEVLTNSDTIFNIPRETCEEVAQDARDMEVYAGNVTVDRSCDCHFDGDCPDIYANCGVFRFDTQPGVFIANESTPTLLVCEYDSWFSDPMRFNLTNSVIPTEFCDELGSCCLLNGTQLDGLTEEECMALMGTNETDAGFGFQGIGTDSNNTVCPMPPVPCCYPNGTEYVAENGTLFAVTVCDLVANATYCNVTLGGTAGEPLENCTDLACPDEPLERVECEYNENVGDCMPCCCDDLDEDTVDHCVPVCTIFASNTSDVILAKGPLAIFSDPQWVVPGIEVETCEELLAKIHMNWLYEDAHLEAECGCFHDECPEIVRNCGIWVIDDGSEPIEGIFVPENSTDLLLYCNYTSADGIENITLVRNKTDDPCLPPEEIPPEPRGACCFLLRLEEESVCVENVTEPECLELVSNATGGVVTEEEDLLAISSWIEDGNCTDCPPPLEFPCCLPTGECVVVDPYECEEELGGTLPFNTSAEGFTYVDFLNTTCGDFPPCNDECVDTDRGDESVVSADDFPLKLMGSTVNATAEANLNDSVCSYFKDDDGVGVWYVVEGNGNLLSASLCNNMTDFSGAISVFMSKPSKMGDGCDQLECKKAIVYDCCCDDDELGVNETTYHFQSLGMMVFNATQGSEEPAPIPVGDGEGPAPIPPEPIGDGEDPVFVKLPDSDIEAGVHMNLTINNSTESALMCASYIVQNYLLPEFTNFGGVYVYKRGENASTYNYADLDLVWIRVSGGDMQQVDTGVDNVTVVSGCTEVNYTRALQVIANASMFEIEFGFYDFEFDTFPLVVFSGVLEAKDPITDLTPAHTDVRWCSEDGVLYYILVHGKEQGEFGLQLEDLGDCPANDECPWAQVIHTLPYWEESSNEGTTGFDLYPSFPNTLPTPQTPLCGYGGTCGLWYKVKADDRVLRASTCSPYTDILTTVSVFQGDDCESLECVVNSAVNETDNFCGALGKRGHEVEWCAEWGVWYWILVAGETDEELGDFFLHVEEIGFCECDETTEDEGALDCKEKYGPNDDCKKRKCQEGQCVEFENQNCCVDNLPFKCHGDQQEVAEIWLNLAEEGFARYMLNRGEGWRLDSHGNPIYEEGDCPPESGFGGNKTKIFPPHGCPYYGYCACCDYQQCLARVGTKHTNDEWATQAHHDLLAAYKWLGEGEADEARESACCAQLIYTAINDACDEGETHDLCHTQQQRNQATYGFGTMAYEDNLVEVNSGSDGNDWVTKYVTVELYSRLQNGVQNPENNFTLRAVVTHLVPQARGSGFGSNVSYWLSAQAGPIDAIPNGDAGEDNNTLVLAPACGNVTRQPPLLVSRFNTSNATVVMVADFPTGTFRVFGSQNVSADKVPVIPDTLDVLFPLDEGRPYTNTLADQPLVPASVKTSTLVSVREGNAPRQYAGKHVPARDYRWYLLNSACGDLVVDLYEIDPTARGDLSNLPLAFIIPAPVHWEWSREGVPLCLPQGPVCVGGDNAGQACDQETECPHGTCVPNPPADAFPAEGICLFEFPERQFACSGNETENQCPYGVCYGLGGGGSGQQGSYPRFCQFISDDEWYTEPVEGQVIEKH